MHLRHQIWRRVPFTPLRHRPAAGSVHPVRSHPNDADVGERRAEVDLYDGLPVRRAQHARFFRWPQGERWVSIP